MASAYTAGNHSKGRRRKNQRGRSDERARLTAIDGNACAGHEAGLLGCQDQDRFSPNRISVRCPPKSHQFSEYLRRHLLAQGVSFAEAVSVLEDECALTREDSDSQGEQRFVTLGLSNIGNLLVVVYTYRESDIIRIISAWKANKRQRVQYEKTRC